MKETAFLLILLFFPTFCFASPQTGTISGRIVDSQTGQRLANVNIAFVQQQGGTTTDHDGKFILAYKYLQPDSLRITHIGYKPVTIPLVDLVYQNQPVTIRLEPTILQMPGINVSSTRYEKERQRLAVEPTPHFLSGSELSQIPTVAVPDFHRALQTIPGVTSNNEITPQLSVRGGNFDQNLLLLDGAVIYYPYHFGLLSGFNVDMIDAVNLSSGGFSAAFGNRLSSVISIHTRQPQKDFVNRANLSLVNADLTMGGMIGSKVGWMFSGQRSYYDLLARIAGATLPFSFYDYYGKITLQPDSRHFVTLSAYQSRDINNITDTDLKYLYSSLDEEQKQYKLKANDHFTIQNKLLSLGWEYYPSKSVQTNLLFTTSIYSNTFDKRQYAEYPDNLPQKFNESRNLVEQDIAQQNRASAADIGNRLTDYTGKFFLTRTVSPKLSVESGLQISHFDFDYGWQGYYDFSRPYVNYFFDHAPVDSFLYQNTADTQSGFVELLWQATERLQIRQGMRISRWNKIDRLFWEPRFNLKLELNKNLNLKFAYGEFTQGIATSLEDGLLGGWSFTFRP